MLGSGGGWDVLTRCGLCKLQLQSCEHGEVGRPQRADRRLEPLRLLDRPHREEHLALRELARLDLLDVRHAVAVVCADTRGPAA